MQLMGILNLFKRTERPFLPRIDHPIFGRMEATLVNEDGSYFWETPDGVPTTNGPISIFLDGDVNGPSEAQIVLWRWIDENSQQLINAVRPFLLDRLREFGLESRISDLVWNATGLTSDGASCSSWDLSFELSSGKSRFDGAILTAYFVDGVPTGVVSFDD